MAAASTVAVDVTGILAASLLAGLGLFVLPNKRRQARRDFHARAEELEQRLIEVMREQFEHELARSLDRVRDAIAPYTRFVRSQFEHLEQMRNELTSIDNDMRALRYRIGDEPSLPAGERPATLPASPAAARLGPPDSPPAEQIIDMELVERPEPGAQPSRPTVATPSDADRPEDV